MSLNQKVKATISPTNKPVITPTITSDTQSNKPYIRTVMLPNLNLPLNCTHGNLMLPLNCTHGNLMMSSHELLESYQPTQMQTPSDEKLGFGSGFHMHNALRYRGYPFGYGYPYSIFPYGRYGCGSCGLAYGGYPWL